jgi:hypothetical protein
MGTDDGISPRRSFLQRLSREAVVSFFTGVAVTVMVLQVLGTNVKLMSTSLETATTPTRMKKGSPFGVSVDSSKVERPFPMPIHGGSRFDIFQPLYDTPESVLGDELLAPPEIFLSFFEARLEWLDTITIKISTSSLRDRARFAYLEMLKSHLTGTVFNSAELGVTAALNVPQISLTKEFNIQRRKTGLDWTYLGDTMTGWARMNNVADLLKDVIVKQVPGDYMETGVWRGGSSMFARAVLRTYNETDKRKSIVCDSFRGLPPGDKKLAKKDTGWDNTPYLEVSENIVANGFRKYGLLDSGVVFAKGFFNETMPPLSNHVEKLAIMRLDVSANVIDILLSLFPCSDTVGLTVLHARSRF